MGRQLYRDPRWLVAIVDSYATYTIKEAREVGALEEVLDMCKFIIKRLNRAEEWMNEYTPNPIKNKSNFMSILNDL